MKPNTTALWMIYSKATHSTHKRTLSKLGGWYESIPTKSSRGAIIGYILRSTLAKTSYSPPGCLSSLRNYALCSQPRDQFQNPLPRERQSEISSNSAYYAVVPNDFSKRGQLSGKCSPGIFSSDIASYVPEEVFHLALPECYLEWTSSNRAIFYDIAIVQDPRNEWSLPKETNQYSSTDPIRPF
jgi:hypothetical protein